MAGQTKTGNAGTLFLAAVLVVGAGFFYGFVKRAPSDERNGVIFTVTFSPAQRVTSVDIIVRINGTVTVTEQIRKSPWETVVQLQRGQTATLIATQTVPSTLSCAANGEVQETRDIKGSVMCTYKRV